MICFRYSISPTAAPGTALLGTRVTPRQLRHSLPLLNTPSCRIVHMRHSEAPEAFGGTPHFLNTPNRGGVHSTALLGTLGPLRHSSALEAFCGTPRHPWHTAALLGTRGTRQHSSTLLAVGSLPLSSRIVHSHRHRTHVGLPG